MQENDYKEKYNFIMYLLSRLRIFKSRDKEVIEKQINEELDLWVKNQLEEYLK